MEKIKVNKIIESRYEPTRKDMFESSVIRHIYLTKEFKLPDLVKYGFVKDKMSGYYELWIRGKRAIVVPTGRRVRTGHKIMLECCTARPSIEMFSVIIKMTKDGILDLYEESRYEIKKRKIENLQKELELL